MYSLLTINGGSSSIKFALYQKGEVLERGLYGKVDRIGLSGTNLTFHDPTGNRQDSHSIATSDPKSAANFLIDWLAEQNSFESVRAIGHQPRSSASSLRVALTNCTPAANNSW
jgi:acetate kinase